MTGRQGTILSGLFEPKRLRAGLLGAAFSVVALSAASAQTKTDVIHWWTSAGESAALKVFADQFTKAGGTWVDTAIAGGVNARTAAINRIVGGQPPTAMQFNTGKQFEELVANGLLRDVDAIATAGNWRKVIPAPIVDAVSRDGKIYVVPVNIHGENWLFYNRAVLEKAGVEPPKTYDELLTALDKLKAAGVVPLAFSGQKNWERNLFNAVLAGKAGRDFYIGIYGKRDADLMKSPTFRTVAEMYRSLRGYVDQASAGRSWNDATAMVITGKAGMQIMGDWAKGEFTAAGLTPGKEYGCTIVGQPYIMTGDVFAFPKLKDKDQTAAQDLLAKTLMDPVTQIGFNQKKGSVPARLDADTSSLDACAQAGAKILADPSRQTPAVWMLIPTDVVGATEDVISQFWNNSSMSVDDFSTKFAQALKSGF